jgi:hypothetical protein
MEREWRRSSAPRSAVLMESALRLIQGDAHQWSEQTRSCPVIRGSGYPTKLTEPRLGCSPPGRRQERREQDARAREVPSGSAEGFPRRVLALPLPGRLRSEVAPLLAMMRHLPAPARLLGRADHCARADG